MIKSEKVLTVTRSRNIEREAGPIHTDHELNNQNTCTAFCVEIETQRGKGKGWGVIGKLDVENMHVAHERASDCLAIGHVNLYRSMGIMTS